MKVKELKIISIFILILALAGVDYFFNRTENDRPELKVGDRFPAIRVRSLSGKEQSFDEHILQKIVLIVFSTSCVHCIAEMKFWNEYASGIDDSVDVTAISADDPESTDSFVKEYQIIFPVFTCAAKDVTDTLHVRSIPMVFFIDGEKRLRTVIVGNQPKESVIAQLGEFLKQQVHGRTDGR